MRRISCGVVVAVLLVGVATAQTQGSDRPGTLKTIGGMAFSDELEVTVVNLDVHVTDTDGNAVTDLAEGDFRVLQDGEEKQVTNFELYTEERVRSQMGRTGPGAVPVPVSDTGAGPEVRPTHLVLYVDNENLRPFDRNRVLRQVRGFLETTVQPPVQMMVVSYQKSFRVLQPFTSDSRAVLDTLRDLRTMTGGLSERESTRREILDAMRRYQDQGEAGSGYGPNQSGEVLTIQNLILGYAREVYNDVLFTVDALRSVVTSLAGLPGRKGVIYISNGLPMVAGLELFYEYADVFKDYSMLTAISQYDRSRLFDGLASSANAQGVSFYTIGAAGLEVRGMGVAEFRTTQSPLAASLGSRNHTDTLVHLANETGGLSIINTNDVSLGLERVRQDLFTYYSIGYPLSSSGADKVHSIEVSLPNHPDLEVRYPRRFVEKSVETRVQDTVITGLILGVTENPLAVELEGGSPSPATGDRFTVPLHVSFPLERVALIPEGEDYVGRVALFVAARDDEGKQSDMVRQEHEVRVKAVDYELARGTHWGIDLSLLTESGSFRVTVGLLDHVTRQHSYQTTRVVVGAR